MGIVEIILVALSLSMDAFAVSVCKGLSMKKIAWEKAIIIGLYFGVFQMIMPIIGYSLGTTFEGLVTKIDHWIAFVLLLAIGGKMILESRSKADCEQYDDSVNFKTMIVLAIATSIDALAIGISFAFLQINILFTSIIIGVTTFILSLIGVKVGNRFGDKYEKKAELVGGLILIIIALKILIEHLGIF